MNNGAKSLPRNMKLLFPAVFLFCAALVGCQTPEPAAIWTGDPYLPSRQIRTEGPSGEPEIGYQFSKAQIAALARVKMDTNRLSAYLEARWPVERLVAYCTPTNLWPEFSQNLVALGSVFATEIHKTQKHPFDRIFVYGSSDDGKGTYLAEAGSQWRRWRYSLNIYQGTNHWAIIEPLPNDFMDSPKYDPGARR